MYGFIQNPRSCKIKVLKICKSSCKAFLDGKQEGAWSGWNPDGTRRSEQYYSQGRRTGTHTLWFTNGQIKETGPYVNGLRHGPWQFYDFQGNPDLRTGTYVNGQRVTDGN